MTERIRDFLRRRRDEGLDDGPCLVVDLDVVRENYGAFAKALPDSRVFYAVKANPAPELLSLLASLGSGMAGYSSLIPARSITSAHFLESDAISAPNSSGVPPAGSSPTVANHWLMAGDRIALLMAALSLSTIGRGTPAGAMMPDQVAAT